MSARKHAPLLYAFYGDDFTGSTDVLESLGIHGVDAVLFTRTPTARDLNAFSHCRAIGIAGECRSRSPEWMSRNLPAIFRALSRLGAPVNHYKVCSTFDSSPHVGNIGRAMEIGRSVFGPQPVPIVVGAPRLGRAVVFGKLYATAGGEFYRIDHHPTMRRHPVTPMTEADLRRHLALQTRLRTGLVDLTAFSSRSVDAQFQNQGKAAQAIVFDGFIDAMLEQTARLICDRANRRPIFAVGSSGLTHGLLLHWSALGLIPPAKPPAPAQRVDRLLVLSGSCSPITANQIRHATKSGFATLHLQGPAPWRVQATRTLESLARGQSVVLYTALGPQAKDKEHGEYFGRALGTLLRRLVLESGVRRVLIAGGDTSTHAVKQLDLHALTFAASLSPGVPLCRAHAPGSPLHGLELALKGGQMGSDEFFARVRDGRAR
ncbi:MAG: four-carbon acid sugar kinase family protein [Terracidiphilus sp.]